MKTTKKHTISVDLSAHPKIKNLLRMQAALTGETQKAILTQALNAYFATKLTSQRVLTRKKKQYKKRSSSTN